MISNAAAKAAQPQTRAYKMFDAGGLHLFVAPTGLKSWRLKYRFHGKEKLLTLGRFPDLSIAAARSAREEAKEQLRAGEDPARQASKLESFEQLARAWHEHQSARWSTTHAGDVLASLERDIFPAIGTRPIDQIGAAELLNAMRSVEGRGCIETASRIRQRVSAVFGFAIAQGLIATDPAAQLGRAMAGGALSRPHPALVSIEDCRALLKACDLLDGRPMTKLASRFLALTAVRLDAVRGMRFGELEDLDGPAPSWIVPPARMKLARAKKGEERFAHRVPLNAAAVEVLRRAVDQNGYDTPWASPPDALVFPGRDRDTPIGQGTIGALYARAGFSGRHVPHGWRSSFSTILNETMGEDYRSAIDRALAHSPKDKVEAAYNRSELLERRREIFDRWGALLAGN